MDNPVEERLRRHLRALSATNRRLLAELEGSAVETVVARPPAPTPPTDSRSEAHERRALQARSRLERLELHADVGPAELVRSEQGRVFVVEGGRKREVKQRLVADMLASALETRRVGDDELARMDDGVPVDVYQGPEDKPFVVVGGERRALRGVPVAAPVSELHVALFPEGAPLELPARATGRARASAPRTIVQRTRRIVGNVGKRFAR